MDHTIWFSVIILTIGIAMLMASLYSFGVIGRVKLSRYGKDHCAKERHAQSGTGHEHGMVQSSEDKKIKAQSKVSQSFSKAVS